MSRIISEAELQEEGRNRTVRCTACRQWIRYLPHERVTDKAGDRRYIPCPGCGHERLLALGGIRD